MHLIRVTVRELVCIVMLKVHLLADGVETVNLVEDIDLHRKEIFVFRCILLPR